MPQPSTIEQKLYFINQSAAAYEQMSQGEYAEALATFRELEADHGEFDEDGFVAMSIGDCLVALGQPDEARQTYEAIAVDHPELADAVHDRLFALQLQGPLSDEQLDELRKRARTDKHHRYRANLQLATALEHRARSLLLEAAAAYQVLLEKDSVLKGTNRLQTQISILNEIADELASLLDSLSLWIQTERLAMTSWPAPAAANPAKVAIEQRDLQWHVRTTDGRELTLEMTGANGGCDVQLSVDGTPVELSDSQRAGILHHEQRITALLTEALEEQRHGDAP